MGLARFQTNTSNTSFNMPSNDMSYSPDPGGFETVLNDRYENESNAEGQTYYNNDGWGASDHQTSSSGYEPNYWANDSEIVGASGDDEGGFWDGVWDFVSSDGVMNALSGMLDVGLDMWEVNGGMMRPSSSGGSHGGGGAGPASKEPITVTLPTKQPRTFKA